MVQIFIIYKREKMKNNINCFYNWGFYGESTFYVQPKITIKDIEKSIAEAIGSIEEKNDILYIGDKAVLVDDYVKGGNYNTEDGTLTLTMNDEGKVTTIEDMPKPMTEEDINSMF